MKTDKQSWFVYLTDILGKCYVPGVVFGTDKATVDMTDMFAALVKSIV